MKIRLNRHGITLVETMASVLIFLLVGASILNVCAQSTMTGRRAQVAFTAYNLAKNHIEELKNLPFSSLANAEETETSLNESGVTDPAGTYFRTTDVSVNYDGDTDLTQVTVSVDYTVRGRVSANPMTLTTVIYQNA